VAAQATLHEPPPTASGDPADRTRSDSPTHTDPACVIEKTAELLAQAGHTRVPDTALTTARSHLESVVGDRRSTGRVRAEALRVLVDVHRTQSRGLQRRRATAVRAISEIRQCMAGLEGLNTAELVHHIPLRLCGNLSFRRAMVSSVSGSTWIPRHLHIADRLPTEQQFLDYVATNRINLQYAPFESEAVRLRAPMLSTSPDSDQRTFKELVEISGCEGYIAAPIVSRGRSIGLLHVDQPDHGRISRTDAEIVGVAAECTSLLFEHALLEERLAASAAQIESGLALVAAELTETGRHTHPMGEEFDEDQATRSARATGHEPSFLTPRERDVMREMITGATNADIARALYISEETVKSHLKQISKKLGTSTRAAAIAKFAQLSRNTVR
jgi:DNA-binding CsgD family transcriptional regulator